jgi:hypothetical protein
MWACNQLTKGDDMTRTEQLAYARKLLGQIVDIDSSGQLGRLTSVEVTSDGFIIGHTSPGHDRGVFLGRVPEGE